LKSTPGCPVCQARFRGSSQCSRCGADLLPLMTLAAHAWRLREAARQALRQGDCSAALASARAAQQLQATEEGRLLVGIAGVNAIQGK